MPPEAGDVATTTDALRAQVIVIGSGAGGAVTAATLAEQGYDVVILEEGPDLDTRAIASNSIDAISRLYRNGGMTPILGKQTMAYVEGRCVGGSTEINSGFWHRLPDDCYHRWKADYLLDDFSPDVMDGHFEALEAELSVSRSGRAGEGRGSAILRRGSEQLDWRLEEVPRCLKDPTASAFSPGTKQSMQRTFVPRALSAGARLMADCTVSAIECEEGRAIGVRAIANEGGRRIERRIRADWIFVCCGAIQTPALLRRSRIRKNVGNSLCIHPMIKAAAIFDEEMNLERAPIPIYQVKEFHPTITLGGSVFTPGFLAMLLSDNWTEHQDLMKSCHRMGLYYAATRGLNSGSIRALPGGSGSVIRYGLNRADQRNLSIGLAHLGELLFAAGARAVYPAIRSSPALTSAAQCRSFLKADIPASRMSLSTVHVFSSCPMGENPDRCATDSFGRVRGFDNLFVNDASLIPDSPGANPQGTTMAIALRNVNHFIEESVEKRRTPRRRSTTPTAEARILVTGATGWLGSRLVELLGDPSAAERLDGRESLRCLVPQGFDPSPLTCASEGLQVAQGDLRDLRSLREFCGNAAGATLFHTAGVIHPRRIREFDEINVEGTRNLLFAARAAGVRRVVVVSSNSVAGCNLDADQRFDEASPDQPYMGYGRSKQAMERIVAEAQAEGALQTVIVRPPWFYGPNQPPRQTTFFQMIRDGRFPVLGDGRQMRSMVYIDNLCQGLLLAASVEAANGQTYWIADERPYSINEIVATVADVLENDFGIRCSQRRMRLPSAVGNIAQAVDGAIQSLGLYEQRIHVLGEMNKTIACSIEKAKSELGYHPRYALREGMAASVRWCLENGQHL